MTKEFLTKEEVFVVKGYLSKDAKKVVPVFNQAFVDAQKHAEYIVTFAKMAKGKDFDGKKADSVDDLRNAVKEALSANDTKYLEEPKKPSNPTQSKLAKEALSFINHNKEVSKVEEVNEFLQQFNIINEFSEIGLFFEQDVVKLNKIYTMDEIVKAVEATIDLA